MADKNTRRGIFGELGAPSLADIVAHHEREKEMARESIRKGESEGTIGLDGSVTVKVDAISSVRYGFGTSVTYVW